MDTRMGYVEGWKVLAFGSDMNGSSALFSPVRITKWTSPVKDAECANLTSLKRVMDSLTFVTEDERQQMLAGHDRNCSCGLYATTCLDELTPYVHTRFGNRLMLARVRGYGKVTEGDRAWRSQSMEIMEVCPIANEILDFSDLGDSVSGVPVFNMGLKSFIEKYGYQFSGVFVGWASVAFAEVEAV